ncbi:MAG: glycosyltransferase [Candidatus Helarchaeota archaeon]|nr:glycosyltransferase [Candidatus Helarchaeota archaeon]
MALTLLDNITIAVIVVSVWYIIYHFAIYYGIYHRVQWNEFLYGEGFKPAISVIIASKNEEKDIENCLNAILNQDYPENKFEILVVDESTDNTPNIINNIAKRYPEGKIKLIRPPPPPPHINGISYSITKGVRAAKNEVIAVTEADCIPSREWLKFIVYPLTPHNPDEVGIVGSHGIIIGDSLSANLQRLEFSGFLFAFLGALDRARQSVGVGGASWGGSMCFRKKSFEQIRGYEGVEHIHLQDIALTWKFAKAGFKTAFLFNQRVKVVTRPHPQPIKQRLRWFRGGWQCRFHYTYHIGAVNIYGVPLAIEMFSLILIILAIFEIIPMHLGHIGFILLLITTLMKYLTLLQFTKSKLLLGNYKHSWKAILLYGFWMFIIQWIWFISIFTKPKYKWKEVEKYKDEEISSYMNTI